MMDDPLEPITIGMLGEKITWTRAQWLELLECLKPDSRLAQRISMAINSQGDRNLISDIQRG